MIFIRGARQLLTLRGPAPRRGVRFGDLGLIRDGSVLVDGEKIREVGSTRRIENLAAARSATMIDATGRVVLPGFVDSHTKPLFTSPPMREVPPGAARAARRRPDVAADTNKLAERLLQTVSPKALRLRSRRWTAHFAAHGTTTIEIRSGWGLNLERELKSLRLARALQGDPIDVAPAFLAAVSTSGPDADPEDALEHCLQVMLPAVRRRRLSPVCDVDCDPSAFHLKRGRRVLEAARQLGFRLKVQSGRTAPCGASTLAVEMNAVSVDDLRLIEDAEIDTLARSPTIATLLPAVAYERGSAGFAPARQLLDRGAAVALASGFAPDRCPALSMPLVLSLACTWMRMLPEEAISAATINGAAALGRSHLLGSLEPGKQADLTIFDVADYRELPYYFGTNLCVMTMKKGEIIHWAPVLGDPPLPIAPELGPVPRSPHAEVRGNTERTILSPRIVNNACDRRSSGRPGVWAA